MRRIALRAIAFGLIANWSFAEHDPAYCRLPGESTVTLFELHLYASIAESAYTYRSPVNMLFDCFDSPVIRFAIADLSEDDLKGIASEHIRRSGDEDGSWIAIEWNNDGVLPYASCGPKHVQIGIAPIERLESDEDGGWVHKLVGLLFSLTGKDEIIHFVEADVNGNPGIAIKGTDFSNPEEITTSKREIVGKSVLLTLLSR